MDCDIWKPHKNQQHGHKEEEGGGGWGKGLQGCHFGELLFSVVVLKNQAVCSI